jgi:hypothetical protein
MALPIGIIGLFFVIAGTGLLLYGWRRRSYHAKIAETPTTDILQIDEPGLVELSGEVVPNEDAERGRTFETTLSETEDTVVAGWCIEEWSESRKFDRWSTLARGVDAVPFVLDDGTGEVMVDVGSQGQRASYFGGILNFGELQESVELGDTTVDFRELPTVWEVGVDEEPPQAVQTFVDEKESVPRQTDSITNVVDVGHAHGDRRYREATITVGDDVSLVGSARAKDDNQSTSRLYPEDAFIEPAPDDDEPFILSERSAQELVATTQSWRYYLAAGALMVLIGLGMIGSRVA